MPEFNSGGSPFTVYFNADEEPGVTRVEIFHEMAGPQNAAIQSMQDAARALTERFPINMIALKRCSSPE